MKHKPYCSSNMRCTVYHESGRCPGYKECNCIQEKPDLDDMDKLAQKGKLVSKCKYCDVIKKEEEDK